MGYKRLKKNKDNFGDTFCATRGQQIYVEILLWTTVDDHLAKVSRAGKLQ